MHYAVLWYFQKIGMSIERLKCTTLDESCYAMNEATDLRHVVYGDLPLKKWIKDFMKVDSFSLWSWKDPIPSLIQYAHLIGEIVKRR